MQVGTTDNPFLPQSAFAFSGFLGKNMSFEGFLVSDFTATGHFKALFGAAVCFNLWHNNAF